MNTFAAFCKEILRGLKRFEKRSKKLKETWKCLKRGGDIQRDFTDAQSVQEIWTLLRVRFERIWKDFQIFKRFEEISKAFEEF